MLSLVNPVLSASVVTDFSDKQVPEMRQYNQAYRQTLTCRLCLADKYLSSDRAKWFAHLFSYVNPTWCWTIPDKLLQGNSCNCFSLWPVQPEHFCQSPLFNEKRQEQLRVPTEGLQTIPECRVVLLGLSRTSDISHSHTWSLHIRI